MKRFKRVLSTASGKPIKHVKQSIHGITLSETSCIPLETSREVEVELFPELTTRDSTAAWLDGLLEGSGITAAPGTGSEGLFSWLAMIALPSLCGRNKSGRLSVKDLERYAQTREASGFYRHLVSGPYWFKRHHGLHARVFLGQLAHEMPDVQEQVVSRPWFRESKAAIEVVDRLYWDEANSGPKPGYTATIRVEDPPPGTAKTQPRPGTLRALETFLSQLQCTYDLQTMTAEQVLALLPDQFGPWLEG